MMSFIFVFCISHSINIIFKSWYYLNAYHTHKFKSIINLSYTFLWPSSINTRRHEESSGDLPHSQTPIPSEQHSTPLPRMHSRSKITFCATQTSSSWATSPSCPFTKSTLREWALATKVCSTERVDGLRALIRPSLSNTLVSWKRSIKIKDLQPKSKPYARSHSAAC